MSVGVSFFQVAGSLQLELSNAFSIGFLDESLHNN